VKIEVSHDTALADVRVIENGLFEHARVSGIEPRNYRPVGFLLRDENGALVGGLIGATVWGWLQIRDLWIVAHARGQGWGSTLMDHAEREGIARGCHHACLDTFDFQALEFYRRRGYEVFGTLRDFPTGHERYFVSKRLDRPTPP
jgi:ribosomal protein S18 acetylase RimI-like enzyme